MASQDIYERLTAIMQKLFKDGTLVARPEITAKEVAGWDSLNHIRFVLEVERNMNVKFSTSEISKFKKVGDLAELIERKLAR